MSQVKQLMGMMKRKWVTDLDALQEAQCRRLAARVYDIRMAGHTVKDKWIDLDNGKRIKAYRILPQRRVADALADSFIAEACN